MCKVKIDTINKSVRLNHKLTQWTKDKVLNLIILLRDCSPRKVRTLSMSVSYFEYDKMLNMHKTIVLIRYTSAT